MSKRTTSNPVARLPKSVRDALGALLSEGVPTAEARERLGAARERVTVENIECWRKTGYEAWLKDRQWLEELRAKREFALELLTGSEGTLKEAGLEMAAAWFYDVLKGFKPGKLQKKLEDAPAEFARIVTALARVSDGALKFEKYRAQVAEQKAKIAKALAGAGESGLKPESVAEIEEALKLL